MINYNNKTSYSSLYNAYLLNPLKHIYINILRDIKRIARSYELKVSEPLANRYVTVTEPLES